MCEGVCWDVLRGLAQGQENHGVGAHRSHPSLVQTPLSPCPVERDGFLLPRPPRCRLSPGEHRQCRWHKSCLSLGQCPRSPLPQKGLRLHWRRLCLRGATPRLCPRSPITPTACCEQGLRRSGAVGDEVGGDVLVEHWGEDGLEARARGTPVCPGCLRSWCPSPGVRSCINPFSPTGAAPPAIPHSMGKSTSSAARQGRLVGSETELSLAGARWRGRNGAGWGCAGMRSAGLDSARCV